MRRREVIQFEQKLEKAGNVTIGKEATWSQINSISVLVKADDTVRRVQPLRHTYHTFAATIAETF